MAGGGAAAAEPASQPASRSTNQVFRDITDGIIHQFIYLLIQQLYFTKAARLFFAK